MGIVRKLLNRNWQRTGRSLCVPHPIADGSLEPQVYTVDVRLAIGRWRKPLDRPKWSLSKVVTNAIGAIAVIVVHLSLVTPLLWGVSRPHARLPNDQGAGAHVSRSQSDAISALILVPIQTSSQQASDVLPESNSAGTLLDLTPIRLASPDPAERIDFKAFVDDRNAQAPEGAGDSPERAVQFGRYLGQITARIERAWERPRVAIGAEEFQCRVRIEQDAIGNVGEVTLEDCNGNLVWGQSLVRAIVRASPLPVPADRSLLTDALVVLFKSRGYVSGGDDTGFSRAAVASAEWPDQLARRRALAASRFIGDLRDSR